MSVLVRHMTPDEIASFMQEVIVQHHQYSAYCRRSEPREPVAIPVRVQQLDENCLPTGPVISAVTRDMSVGGIGFFHTHPIELGRIQIRLEAPCSRDNRTLLARVEHCTPCGDFYIVGCRIESVSPAV
jgi:hypothetical protein